jgi:hypothetical protein
MSNLLFFSRSCAYCHAARTELREARLLPRGSERNQARKRARALRDLARNEAWLEGHLPRIHRSHPRLATPVNNFESIDSARGFGSERVLLWRQRQAPASRRRVNLDGLDCSLAAAVPDPQSGD